METTTQTQNVYVASALATRRAWAEQDWSLPTGWYGEVDASMTPEDAFRFFNRVTEADAERLERMGYQLPSLSVGDLLTLGGETFKVAPVGFEKVDAPEPCGYCRRCAIHDDPGGCLEVAAWEREQLGVVA